MPSLVSLFKQPPNCIWDIWIPFPILDLPQSYLLSQCKFNFQDSTVSDTVTTSNFDIISDTSVDSASISVSLAINHSQTTKQYVLANLFLLYLELALFYSGILKSEDFFQKPETRAISIQLSTSFWESSIDKSIFQESGNDMTYLRW